MCYTLYKTEVFMKLTKNQTIVAVCSMLIVILSTTLTLVTGLVEKYRFWIPALNFFFFLFVGFSVLFYVCAFVKGNSFHFFLGCVLMIPCIVYVLIMVRLPWWAVLIIAFTVVAVTIGLSFIRAGDNTEGVSLNARENDGKKDDGKN